MAIKRNLRREAQEESTPEPTPTNPQILDDQTPIDDLSNRTKKNKAKEEDLGRFDKRIPAGSKRLIRVLPSRIGEKNPILIKESNGKLVGTFEEVKIEDASSLEHQIRTVGCGEKQGSVCIVTEASILVRRAK